MGGGVEINVHHSKIPGPILLYNLLQAKYSNHVCDTPYLRKGDQQ